MAYGSDIKSLGRMSIDDLNIAIDWLDANEGQDHEESSCKRVAQFLRQEVATRLRNMAISEMAKKCGVPESTIRAKLKKSKKNAS